MSEETKPTEVFIERMGKTYRWGQHSYFRSWNGFKFTLNSKFAKGMALPAAGLIGVFIFFSKRSDLNALRSKEFSAPVISSVLPVIDSKIQTEQDLINRIKKVPVKVSALGGIKIFSLSGSSEIPVGSEAMAILESGATNGIVKAKLTSPIIVDGERLIPEHATLFGSGKSTEERLFVEFTKVIFPNGESIPIRAQAFDLSDKIQGLKGSFVGTKSKKMAAAMGFGLLGGMADGLQDTSGSMFAYERKRSLRDAALSGTSKAALDQSQSYMDEMKNAPNIIEVKRGTEFYLLFDEPKKKEGFKNE